MAMFSHEQGMTRGTRNVFSASMIFSFFSSCASSTWICRRSPRLLKLTPIADSIRAVENLFRNRKFSASPNAINLTLSKTSQKPCSRHRKCRLIEMMTLSAGTRNVPRHAGVFQCPRKAIVALKAE